MHGDTIQGAGSAGEVVALSSSSAALSVPASVTVPAGSATASFTALAGVISGRANAVITASDNSVSQTSTIALAVSGDGLSAFACSPDQSNAGTLDCTVQLAQAAPLNGVTVTLQANIARLQVPAQIQVPAGSQSANFTVQVAASDQDAQAVISAMALGAVQTTSLSIIGIRPTTVTCPSGTVQAGTWSTCEVLLNSSNVPEVAHLAVSSTSRMSSSLPQ